MNIINIIGVSLYIFSFIFLLFTFIVIFKGYGYMFLLNRGNWTLCKNLSNNLDKIVFIKSTDYAAEFKSSHYEIMYFTEDHHFGVFYEGKCILTNFSGGDVFYEKHYNKINDYLRALIKDNTNLFSDGDLSYYE